MTDTLFPDALRQLVSERQSLSREDAHHLMTQILGGNVPEAQIAGILVALAMKGESVEEIVGFAQAIRAAAPPWPGAERASLVDTCGTGGDASGTFNISTAAAIVAAACGVPVAKHGNRSVSSKCGSADVIEALGVRIDLPRERLAACLDELGIVFLYAPALHSALQAVQPVRRQLKIRTVFNLLGPLTNPARASAQVVGVYSAELVGKFAEALSLLGLRRALVVHGNDGLDEITITTSTRIAELRDGQVRTYEVTPEDFGVRRASLTEITGWDAATNAGMIRSVLAGERSARRDVVLVNAAAALVAAGHADSLAHAFPQTAAAVDSGAALEKLEALVRFSNAT